MSEVNGKDFLSGKNILFIGQVFYDYHLKVIRQLEGFGAKVIFFENKNFNDVAPKSGIFNILLNPFNQKKKANYVNDTLQQVASNNFDYLFCIGGFSITNKLIATIRYKNPQVKCILYLWDSLTIWNYGSIINLFDQSFSFDSVDCSKHKNLKYLPLFYTDEYAVNDNLKPDLDLLYIGSIGAISLDRFQILNELKQKAKLLNLKTYFHLYFAPNYGLKNKIDKIRMFFVHKNHYLNVLNTNLNASFLKRNVLSREEIATLMNRAKCVLDIPVKNQSGMTIRTIETLASGKKLITTNEQILNESFYDERMIDILDDQLLLDKKFIQEKNEILNISYLRLDNWIKTIFEIDELTK